MKLSLNNGGVTIFGILLVVHTIMNQGSRLRDNYMNKILLSILLLSGVYNANAQTKRKFEIRTGMVGQFYLARSQNRSFGGNGQIGGSGYYAASGAGAAANLLFHTKRAISFSILPVLRYSKLESYTPYAVSASPDRWGLTLDLHASIQTKLKSDVWLFKNTALGAGVTLLNVGQPFDTRYSYKTSNSPNVQEYQATSLMSFGLHAYYERTFGERLSVRLMLVYTKGDWINWTPFFKSTLHGNVSVQYRVFSK